MNEASLFCEEIFDCGSNPSILGNMDTGGTIGPVESFEAKCNDCARTLAVADRAVGLLVGVNPSHFSAHNFSSSANITEILKYATRHA